MEYIHHYHSPLGGITVASDGEVLTGLWFDGQKYFAVTLAKEHEEKMLPVFEETERWLDIYFQGKEPDYLIVSHMEPDHAANIEMLARRYPKMQIVANAKTFPMMEQFFNLDVSDRKSGCGRGRYLKPW